MIIINENLRITRLDSRNITYEIKKENEKKETAWKEQGSFGSLKKCVNKVSSICTDEAFIEFKNFLDNLKISLKDDSKNMKYKDYLIQSNGSYGGYVLSIERIVTKGKTAGQEVTDVISYPNSLDTAIERIIELEFDKVDNSSSLSLKSAMHLLNTIKESIEKELKKV